MNIQHIKYALAVAEHRSINKAAELLLIGAPALSRSIRDLESSLGVELFIRSAKGMSLTPEGELFVSQAQKALKQIDGIESLFSDGMRVRQHFSISVPRASYIASAFTAFSKRLDPARNAEIYYKETNAYRIINNLIKDDYKLGILRFSESFDRYYRQMMETRRLVGEMIVEFRYVLLISRKSPLAAARKIGFDDLRQYIEIMHADPYVPSLSLTETKKTELPDREGCRIFVFERGSQFDLLSSNPNTYMWVSPIPQDILERYDLVERTCDDNNRIYRDILVRQKDYRLSTLDKMFIEELIKAKRDTFG